MEPSTRIGDLTICAPFPEFLGESPQNVCFDGINFIDHTCNLIRDEFRRKSRKESSGDSVTQKKDFGNWWPNLFFTWFSERHSRIAPSDVRTINPMNAPGRPHGSSTVA
jgi:hypothetical protein